MTTQYQEDSNVFPLSAVFPLMEAYVVALLTKDGWKVNTAHDTEADAQAARSTLRGPINE